ncbi:Carboxylesterase family [Popillia japonica]|uniref:Carboxylic ester hydrolase n=1 Tax=Popillia japonica TaxID=7064 RepID=A0AAW1KMM5_POPJA
MARNVLLISFISFSFIIGCYAEDNLLVSLQDGLVRGQYKESYNGRKFMAFEGIPYAKPPIGDLRFEDPQPVQPWIGVFEAKYLYTCVQISMLPVGPQTDLGDEDCLYLNVYVPREKINPDENLDVILHIHGGAFMIGSPKMLALPNKIMDRDVVYVSINYRLGPFGFYSPGDGHGNYGLKDQTAALKWVQNNIKKFGGNKDSVTITGVSAGGGSTHLHYFTKLSKGLFHRGYAQSGVALNPWAIRKHPEKQGKILAEQVGCFDEAAEEVRRCLKQRPAKQILDAVKVLYAAPLLPLVPFGPIIEKDSPTAFMAKTPYQQLISNEVTDLPFMMSMTSDEGTTPAALTYNFIDAMNSNWTKWAPLLLEFYEYENYNLDEVSEKIKEEYFKGSLLTKDNYKTLVKACTHRIFHLGAEATSRLQTKSTKSDLYFLVMDYSGPFMPINMTGFDVDFGNGHGSDGKYYYSGDFDIPLDQDGVRMKDILLDMMVAFAKTGKPKIDAVQFTPVPKNGHLNYLYVKGPDDIEMRNEDIFGPRKFWTSLGLQES